MKSRNDKPAGFFPVAANKARKVYVHLAGDWPFDCWEGVRSAAVLGIVLPDGSRADYIAHGASAEAVDRAMAGAGFTLCK